MSITTVKILRTISKVVLLVVGIAIVGYGGLMVYKSVINKPQRVRITNVTDSAATITWVTDNPVRGVVYYKQKGTFLPGPLSLIGSSVAYDDRDFANAQDECVKKFNENAKNTKDVNFRVDGSGFDCENISVEKLGAYFTHSVTIKNLDESGTYFFVVGNGIWSWSVDGVSKVVSENDLAVTNSFNFKTSKVLESIPTPNIAYGTVYAGVKSEEGYLSESPSKDSLVFAYVTVGGNNSQVISTVTNTDGGWTFDKSNFRDINGNLITDLSKAVMVVCSQYENVAPKVCMEVKDNLEIDTDVDLLGNMVDDLSSVEKDGILEKFQSLIGKVYAKDNFTCKGNKGVVNCSDLRCVQQCAITGTEDYGWELIGGLCSKPYSCGCELGSCDSKCGTGTPSKSNKRTCNDMGGYPAWSAWEIGTCGGDDKCDVGGSNPCSPNGACENVFNGAKKVCVNGGWDTQAGSCGGSGGGGGGGGGGGDIPIKKCTDDDGKKIMAGDFCPRYGGTCDGRTGKCSQTGSSGTIPTTNQERCSLEPVYETCGVNECLSKCILTCMGGPKSLGSSECKKLASFKDTLIGEKEKNATLEVVDIDLDQIKNSDIKLLIAVDPSTRAPFKAHMEDLIDTVNGWECGDEFVDSSHKAAKNLCKSLGGTWESKDGDYCPGGVVSHPVKISCSGVNILQNKALNLIQKTYAQDSSSDGYTLYLPEYGMYSFELGDYQLTTDTTGGNTYYMFYIETNGKTGFQMPADLDHPTANEDIMLKSSSAQITYEKVASAQSYTLSKGINLISFNFVPVSTELGALSAKGVIEEAAKKDVTIQYISTFEGGRWSKGYTCQNDKCSGNDFNIVPGKGYLIYTTNAGEIAIPGYSLKTSVPVNLSGGWNLVGVNGYTTVYTASSFIKSVNKVDGLTANNVTWWPTSRSMYEGLQVTKDQEYGLDFPISPTNGYFVRISSYKPEDSKCKSLLWNEGGTLNGACGIIK